MHDDSSSAGYGLDLWRCVLARWACMALLKAQAQPITNHCMCGSSMAMHSTPHCLRRLQHVLAQCSPQRSTIVAA